jgi:RNA polymerase sigma factor (sigma-70 family)
MEQKAFEQIARKLRQKVVDSCRYLGTEGEEAEDIAQEVMLKLWSMHEDLDRFHSVEGLAVLMTKHLVIDTGRKRRSSPLGKDELQIIDENSSPSDLMELHEQELKMAQMMATLPDTQNAILRMRQIEHKTNSEIANVLGLEETSVSTLLARARRKLREMMM